ncbi:MAG: hypothetical protein AB7O97_01340 [Planctomycetota bacterium]
MTDSGNVPELQELESLEPGASADGGTAAMDERALQTMRAGLPPPAFNPICTDKTSYRFLMCGVLMVLGCLMPFSADLNQAGYKTMGGAFFMFIGIGMVWTWWAAIHHNRSTGASLKWLGLCLIPMIAQILNMVDYDAKVALDAAQHWGVISGNAELMAPEAGRDDPYTWGTMFSDAVLALSKKLESPQAAERVGIFFRCFGTGKVFVFLGALLAEFFFIAGIVGGAKQNKQQKVQRMAAAAERKRR